MTLLIADDNERIRTMLKDNVMEYFTEIYECGNGQDAVDLYSQNKPDWIFMDIEMPVMDGITATKKIKDNNPGAKVIIVTNYDSNTLKRNAMIAGAMKYILKENADEILKIITN